VPNILTPAPSLPRRTFLQSAATLFTASRARAAKKPNFLFLIADDHAGYILGADGNSQASTPNLDRLAAQSVRFASNFCNAPVCTPSRQSFLTGQMPHAAGVTVLSTPLQDDKPTIAKQLKKAGYQTAVLGKMHFNQPARPGLHGFDYMLTENELTKAWQQQPPQTVPKEIATKPPWHPFKDPSRIWLNADDLPYPRYQSDMRSTYLLQRAKQYLDENKDKQFALWVSYQEPHSPFDFPIQDRYRFTAAGFTAPRVGPEDAPQIPLVFQDLSDADKQGIIAAYYNSARFLDANIGATLDHLQKLGLAENTFVIYMSDHGYVLGQHGRFEKHCCYEPALRVPLMMRWPGRIEPQVIHGITESVDVPHTILDMLEAPPLPIRHGQSLRPYLERKRPANPRDHSFSEYLENEEACIRTPEWKFIHCSGKRERTEGYKTDNPTPGRYIRLYDLKKDPGEFTDVASKNPNVVAKLQSLMLKRFRDTHPDAAAEPAQLPAADAIDWYLRPRDA
jgi:choline-sulfatase